MGCDWRELVRAWTRFASRLGTARLLPIRRAVAKKEVGNFMLMMMRRIGCLGDQRAV